MTRFVLYASVVLTIVIPSSCYAEGARLLEQLAKQSQHTHTAKILVHVNKDVDFYLFFQNLERVWTHTWAATRRGVHPRFRSANLASRFVLTKIARRSAWSGII